MATEELKRWYDDAQARRRAQRGLWISIGATLLLYMIPFGYWVAYPLTLFSTAVHELGHGLTALLTGGRFDKLYVYADTSGVAHSWSGAGDVGRALVAAGGLCGPALFAGVGFVACSRERGARIFLGVVSLGLALTVALFVRNVFGILFTSAVAVGLGALAVRSTPSRRQIAGVFLSVQMALSVFSRGDYLFTDVAHTGAGELPSDVANMATALGGPYWGWGLVCGAFSVLMLWGGVTLFLRRITPKPILEVRKS